MSTFKNFVQCRVTSPITSVANSIGLYAAEPPYTLPSEEGGLLVLTDSPTKPSKLEVISYTSRSELGLYGVIRGLEGTTAQSWTGPVYCYQSLLAGEFKDLLDSKVDKVTGKGLSDTNYTQAEKTKLTGVATDATKNRVDSLNADKVHTHTTAQVTGLDTALAGKADKTTQVIAGTGLTGGGTLASNRTLNVSYGTAASTAAQGNDSRINNGQTAFGWGNHASEGYAKTKADVGLSGIPNTNASTANFLRGDGTWVTPPNTNTTYAEITDAEIDAGTASTLRTISGRRMKYALDKKSDTGHGHVIGDVTGLQAAIDSKADTSTQVIAGTGLTGGGTLAANRTLSVSYGTATGTAAQGNDSRLSNSREWTGATLSQAEAEAGTATTRRAFTAQRVRQAIVAWFNGISGALGRTILTRTTAAQIQSDIGLGTAATYNVGTGSGQLLAVGSNGYGTTDSSSVSDWNEATKNGVYYMASNGLNAPISGWLLGRCQSHNATHCTQTVETFNQGNSPRTFKRHMSSGTWKAWVELINADLVQQSTGTSTAYPMSQKTVTDQLATKANTSTQVITGTGLSGGGSLAANRTLTVNYGTAAGTSAQGNDSRIVNAVPNSRTITAGTGLTGGGKLTANRTLAVTYGTAAGTAAQGNDSRITGALQASQVLQATGTSTTSVMSQKVTTDQLATKAQLSHTHPWSQVTGQPTTATRWPTFAEVTGKPTTFAPSSHTHPWAQVTGVPIVQTVGTSTTNIMSQKAVTEALVAYDQPTMTSNAVLNHTDNSIVATGIVSNLGLEIGDVIEIDNDKLQTGYLKTIGQAVSRFYQFASKGNDVYVVNFNNKIIMKQTKGKGLFVKIEGVPAHSWIGLCFIGNQMYAAAHGGRIYSVNEATGAVDIVSPTNRSWHDLTTDGTHIYGCVNNSGNIFKINPITKTEEEVVPKSPHGVVFGLVYSPIDNSLYIGAGSGAHPIRKLVNMSGPWIDVSTEKKPWSSASYYNGKVYFSDTVGQVWVENATGNDFELFAAKPLDSPNGEGGNIIVNDVLYKSYASASNGGIYTTSIIKKDLFTVESIVSANKITVNNAHAFGEGSKSLWYQTLSATKFKRIAKWYNAPLGLGQAWVDVRSVRSANVEYTPPYQRSIQVMLSSQVGSGDNGDQRYYVNGIVGGHNQTGDSSGRKQVDAFFTCNINESYKAASRAFGTAFAERR